MKRQSLIQKNAKRPMYLVVGLIGIVIIYIIASMVAWSIFNLQSRAQRDEVQSTLRKQIQSPAESLADRQRLHADLVETLRVACRPSRFVAWQTAVLPALDRNVQECGSSLEAVRQALATYRKVTDYRADYEFMNTTIADADRKSRQVSADDTAQQFQIWDQAAVAVSRNEAVDEIVELQDYIAVGLRGVADAWKDAQQSGSYDNVPAAYDALASTHLRIDSALPEFEARFKAQVGTFS